MITLLEQACSAIGEFATMVRLRPIMEKAFFLPLGIEVFAFSFKFCL